MGSVFYLCGLIAFTFAGPVSHRGADLQEVTEANATNVLRATEDDVTYYFYNKYSTEGLFTHINDLSSDEHIKQIFEQDKPTMVLVHGWVDDNTANSNTFVKDVVLDHYDINLVVVDWGPLAGLNYISAQKSVESVGQYIGKFIDTLSKLYNYPLSSITIVGFSLGAHIAGIAGASLNAEIGQIVGLDPAGPLFSASNKNNLLDPGDAQYVTVIHTNAGTLGFSKSLGHSDFYPNGGKSQPGCSLDIVGGCAHARAWAYYAESLVDNKFVGQNCNSYREFSRGRCSGEKAFFGGYDLNRTVLGDFYFNTNSQSPYGQG